MVIRKLEKSVEMLAISLAKVFEKKGLIRMTLAEMGFENLEKHLVMEVVNHLDLGEENDNKNPTNPSSSCATVSLERILSKLKSEERIRDVIGKTKLPSPAILNFTTLLSARTRGYLGHYKNIARTIMETGDNIVFRVWLEDSFSQLYRDWNNQDVQEATKIYEEFFRQDFRNIQITISSTSGLKGVTTEFIEKRISTLTLKEFASLLPFHLKSPELITALDIIHFCWNCYVVSVLPGIHLVGANTKRLYQMFRKINLGNITVVLVPQIND